MMLGGFIGYSVGSTILKGKITEIKIQKHINDIPNAHARLDHLLPAVIDAALEVCVRGPPDGEVPLEEVVFQRLRVVLRRRLGQLLRLSHQTLDGCNYCFVNAVSLYFKIQRGRIQFTFVSSLTRRSFIILSFHCNETSRDRGAKANLTFGAVRR